MTDHIIHTVTIYSINALSAVDLKNQLVREHGLVDGVDFDWAWFPTVLDSYDYFQETPSKLELRFKDPARALFFQLKYSNATT